jgi:pseudouridine synthase, RluA family
MKWVVHYQVSLKEFLETQFPDKSKKAVKKLLDQGSVSVNQKMERFGKVILEKGDVVILASTEAKSEKQTFDPSRILFEDQFLIIYDKPCGIVSDGEDFIRSTPNLIPIHRLDKETSGILMLAKSHKFVEDMVDLFQKKEIKKKYVAWVTGNVLEKSGQIDQPIDVVYREGTAKRYGVKAGGKPALTLYETVESHPEKSLLYLFPITGRTHQLRVHLNFIGHPILGDQVYGRELAPRLFLHAHEISFVHPRTKEVVAVTSPLPEGF